MKTKIKMNPVFAQDEREFRAEPSLLQKVGAFLFALCGVFTLGLAVMHVAKPLFASGPSSNRVLNYQIRLTDANGIPLEGTQNVKLSFYTVASGGTPVHTDCGTTGTPVARKIVVAGGAGSVLIGDTAAPGATNCADASQPNAIPANLFNNTSLYLGVTVGADAEMTPRKRIVSQGYALNADMLDDLDTSAAGGSVAFVPVTDSSGNLVLTRNLTIDGSTLFVDATNNRIGMGEAAPDSQLDVGSAYSAGAGADFFTLDVNPTVTAGANDQVVSLVRLRQRGGTGGFTNVRMPLLVSENSGGGQFKVQLFENGLRIGNYTGGPASVANPSANLELDGFGSTSATFSMHVENSAGADVFAIRDDGRVGIRTFSPGATLDVHGGALVNGDQIVDEAGDVLADPGVGTRTPIVEGATLVSAAGQGLCTNSLSSPFIVYKDGNGDCVSGNGGTDVRLLGVVADLPLATTVVTAAWAFNDADTDCNGDGTGGDGSCTAGDGIYQAGQDLYIDNDPALVYTSPRLGIGTTNPGAMLDVVGRGDGDFAGFPSLAHLKTASSNTWNLVLSNQRAGGESNVTGFYMADPSTNFDYAGVMFVASYADDGNSIVDPIMLMMPGSGSVGIGQYYDYPTKFTVYSEPQYANVGGTTTANASTSITGVGTKFSTRIGLGDRISLSSAPTVFATVTGISSDTALTVDRPLGNGTSQTINVRQGVMRLVTGDDALTRMLMNDVGNVLLGNTLQQPVTKLDLFGNTRLTGKATAVLSGSIDPTASTTVTGVGTAFLRELVVGDRITVSGETRTVTAIASDTSLTVDTAFSDNANDTSPDALFAIATMRDSANALRMTVTDQGNVGIGATAPAQKLVVNGQTRVGESATAFNDFGLPFQFVVNAERTDTSGTPYGTYSRLALNPASASTAQPVALSALLEINGTNSTGSSTGLNAAAQKYGSGAATAMRSLNVFTYNNAGNVTDMHAIRSLNQTLGGTITNAYGLQYQLFQNGGTSTNAYGLKVESPSMGGGTITNLYGLHIDPQTAAGTANFALLYNHGSSPFAVTGAGSVGVGTSNPSLFKLQVDGHVGPNLDDTYDLGSDSMRWRDLYLGPATLHIGTAVGDEASLSYDTGTNALALNSTGTVEINGGFGSTGCSVDASGNFSCSGAVAGGGGAAFQNGGNSFGGTATLGTNDNFGLAFETNGLTRMNVTTAGVVDIAGGGLLTRASADSAGFYSTAYLSATTYGVMTQADRELRVQAGSNAGGQRYQYITYNGRWSGNIDSPTLTQGLYDRVSAIEFNAAADSLGPNPNTSINFIVNTGTKSTGSEMVVTPTRAMSITYTARVGIGSTNPLSKLDVNGNVAVGTYAGTAAAPSNGLIVSGNVGVGTSSPSQKLEVSGGDLEVGSADMTTRSIMMGVDGGSFLGGKEFRILFSDGTNADDELRFKADSVGVSTLAWIDAAGGLDSAQPRMSVGYPLASVTSGVPAGSLVVAGRLGVGTATPVTKLDVLDAKLTDGSASYEVLVGDTTAYNANPVAGILFQTKFNSSGAFAGMGGISVGKENATDGNLASYLALHTRPAGGSTTERLRINSAGNVGIGTSAPNVALTIGTASLFSPLTDVLASVSRNGSGQNAFFLASTDTSGEDAGIIIGTREVGDDSAIFMDQSDARKLKFAVGDSVGGDAGRTADTRMTIDQTGKVGIGTTSPYAAQLHVDKATVGGIGGAIMITNTATATVGSRARLGFDLGGFDDIDSLATIDARLANASTGATDLIFNAYDGSGTLTNYERMRIVGGSGRVGIGTSSPDSRLHVLGADATEWIRIRSSAAGTGGSFDMYSSGTGGFQPGTTGFNSTDGAAMLFNVSGTERMRVHTDGNVGIGETAPTFKLDVNGTSGMRVTGPSMYGLMLKSSSLTSDFMGIRWRDNANANLWSMGNDFSGDGGHDFWLFDNVNGETVLLADPAATSYLSFGTTNGGLEYDNATEQLRVFTSGTNKLFVNSSGSVGIGVSTAPFGKLQVDASAAGTMAENLWLKNSATATVDSSANIVFAAASGAGATTRFAEIRGIATDVSVNPDGALAFVTMKDGGINERMRVDADGRVGINVVPTSNSLQVENAVSNGNVPILSKYLTSSTTGPFSGLAVLAETSGDMADTFGSTIEYQIDDAASAVQTIGRAGFVRDGNDGLGRFTVNPYDSGSPRADAFNVQWGDATGPEVGIGTIDPSTALHVVVSDSVGSVPPILRLQNTTDHPAADVGIRFNSFNQDFAMGIDETDDSFRITDGTDLTATARLMIDPSGTVGVNTAFPSDRFEVAQTAASSTAETIARFTVSDNPGSMLQVLNASTTDGTFAPKILGYQNGSITVSALTLEADVNNDNGTAPMIALNTRVGGSPIGFRPLFAIQNGGVSKLQMDQFGNLAINDTTPDAKFDIDQPAETSGSPKLASWNGGAHTGLTASTEAIDIDFALNRAVEFATGALATQRAFVVRPPTYAFAGSSTLTVAATMNVMGLPAAGTNATITNAAGIIVGDLAGDVSAASSRGIGAMLMVPGITNGTGATSLRTGLWVTTPIGEVALGDQTATLTDFNAARFDDVTLLSTTNTRTVTNASTIYVRGAPVAGTNVSITNGPYAIHVGDGTSRFDTDGATVGIFNRITNDGTLIDLQQDGASEGTISVSGNTVSYNAFTGSHYAWTDAPPEKGMLVTLTGDNRRLHGRVLGEMLYGIAPTSEENDAKVLGAYLALQEPNKPADDGNPHLVMAVGNGDVWVVDGGQDVAIGDYLIASATPGHAVKDPATADVSHVVARAAEPVDWETVTELTADGKKRKLVSVTFESFSSRNVQPGVFGAKLSELTVDAGLDMRGYAIWGISSLRGLDDIWSIDDTGRLVVKEVVVDQVSIRQTDTKSTLDTAKVPAGQDYAQVHNAAINAQTRVFVTFRKNPGSAWWVEEVTDGLFVVKTALPVIEDVTFDYWLVQTLDERTAPQTTVELPPAPAPEPEPQPEQPPAPEPQPVPEEEPETEPVPEQQPTPEPQPEPEPAP